MKVQPRSTRAAPARTQNGGAKITKKSKEKKFAKGLEEEKAGKLKEVKAEFDQMLKEAKAKILREEKAKFDKTLKEVEAKFAEHIHDLKRRNKINEALQYSKDSDIQRLEKENRRLWGRITELELDSVKPITYLVDGR